MKKAIERAIRNVAAHGDTDIFPFPIETRVFHDSPDIVVKYLLKQDKSFDGFITSQPPANYGALAPVGYTGFRWATQIDPLWNIYFLSLVIKIAPEIEKARIPTSASCVFSYRYDNDDSNSGLFLKEYGWRSFIDQAISMAGKYKYVVSCDISEFYPRLNHHRLENALQQLSVNVDVRKKIMSFLSNFSETYSFGLPVGGPGSRLLSELTLNQIDRLLKFKRIPFCRFADDFYIFANNSSEAFKSLVYLSETLQRNQGLQLQKSKTRIMSSAEFLATNPLSMDSDVLPEEQDFAEERKRLFTISLHFDPYSPTAEEDYKKLSDEIGKFPILEIIRSELNKSRVNVALARKLIAVMKFVSDDQLDDAAKTLIEHEELLYPVYYNVLSAVRSIFSRINLQAKNSIINYVSMLIESGSSTMAVDLNVQYAVRLLSEQQSEESMAVLVTLYDSTNSEAIRRDIILIMAKWRNWIWLSDRRAYFRSMRPMERRAYIAASYRLGDEGKHWRDHTKDEFSALELMVRDWVASRIAQPGWDIPI